MTRTQTSTLRKLKATFAAFQRDVQTILAELEHANNVSSVDLPEIRRCMEVACEHYGVTMEEMLSRNRLAHVAWARQVAIYMAMTTTRYKDLQVGAAFIRERTNIVYAVSAVKDRMSTDKAIKAEVEKLIASL